MRVRDGVGIEEWSNGLVLRGLIGAEWYVLGLYIVRLVDYNDSNKQTS